MRLKTQEKASKWALSCDDPFLLLFQISRMKHEAQQTGIDFLFLHVLSYPTDLHLVFVCLTQMMVIFLSFYFILSHTTSHHRLSIVSEGNCQVYSVFSSFFAHLVHFPPPSFLCSHPLWFPSRSCYHGYVTETNSAGTD